MDLRLYANLPNPEKFWRDWTYNFSYVIDNTVNFDTIKDDNNFNLFIALPGVSKEDLDLTIENNKLTITLEKEYKFVAPFVHIVELQEYNEDSIKTNLVNGVLEISMEKKVELKPKKLKI